MKIKRMKSVLITGGSSGIGEAFAVKLASGGHNILLIARSADKLKSVCDRLMGTFNIDAQFIAADLTRKGSDLVIYEETVKRGIEVEWLINNAGIGSGGDFIEDELPGITEMMYLNMTAMVSLTHRFLPQMRERRSGKIINTGSMAGFGPIPYMCVYAASKNFVAAFTEALAEENDRFGVQVVLLCPGATETNFFDAAGIGPERKTSFAPKHLETPEQVVTAAMSGIKKEEKVIISGFRNRIMRRLMYLIPNSLGLALYGTQMRRKLNYE